MTEFGTPSMAIIFALVFGLSWLGVEILRRWILRRGLLDIPNERSSHTTPTPRGGGLVIVVVCMAAYAAVALYFRLPISYGYFVGALMVAGVSWLDDLYSLPFWLRLLIHVTAAVVLVWDVGFWTDLFVPFASTNIYLGSVIGLIFTVSWLVWFLNAYNFMDGIDGIAALQSVIASLAWAVIAYFYGYPTLFLISGIVGVSSLGFLLHNWQPAKIFMGDVGSAFLGFTLAAMPLLAKVDGSPEVPLLPFLGASFVWFFLLDTLFTLAKRLLGREKIWEAHRQHIYQKLTIEGRSHAAVTSLYGAATAVFSIFLVLAVVRAGIYPLIALSSFVILTASIVYFGIRKKNVDLNG